MKTLIKSLPVAIALLTVAGAANGQAPADVRACQAMAQSFGPKQVAIQKAVAARDEAAAAAEVAGEAWENAEAVRNFSTEAAVEADAAKLAYEDAKQAFYNAELTAADLVHAFNRDQQSFNALCVGA